MHVSICRYIAGLLLQGDLWGVHKIFGWSIVCMQRRRWNLLLSFWVRIQHCCPLVLETNNVSSPSSFLLQAHSDKVWNGEYYGLHTPAVQCASADDTNDADLKYSTAHSVSEVKSPKFALFLAMQ